MSSAMVSSYLDYTAERLHTDFSVPDFRLPEEPTPITQNTSGLDGIDLPLSSQFIPAGVATTRPPLNRRHSASLFNSNNLKMLPPGLSTFPDASAAMLTLDTVAEDRFRGRAFSDGSSILSNDSLQDQQTATSRYKTELCRPYEENGKCKYGDKCQFAHGKHEVRHVVRHPKYKTELCRTYHTSGICPYGPRCHFIHNQEDSTALRQTIINERSALGRQCSVPVPISNPTPRNPIVQRSVSHRPANLQLLSQMRSNLNRTSSYGSYSPPNVISSPLGASPPYFIGESPLLSPMTSATSGQFFSSNKGPVELPRTSSFGSAANFPEQLRQTPPIAPIDLFTQGSQFLESCPSTSSDDGVFDGPPTPPDSDRESNTGSPHGATSAVAAAANNGSRLAIFRCLSQSEQ